MYKAPRENKRNNAIHGNSRDGKCCGAVPRQKKYTLISSLFPLISSPFSAPCAITVQSTARTYSTSALHILIVCSPTTLLFFRATTLFLPLTTVGGKAWVTLTLLVLRQTVRSWNSLSVPLAKAALRLTEINTYYQHQWQTRAFR